MLPQQVQKNIPNGPGYLITRKSLVPNPAQHLNLVGERVKEKNKLDSI